MYVTEVLSWQAKANVSDQDMINAVEGLLADLKTLPGFLFQNLSKDSKGRWVEVYFWQTEVDAHNSNSLMADKTSMVNLMGLIEIESISMEVMSPLQDSGALTLNS
ncbi:hypothetical protein TW85_07255 [Marinomonas sp. S3726]|uniref:hypothetical protein n=1 Tax=Marinomonas sp. S3726 TaxID=579484 RepID=UPI0005F9C22D|nr:hypothetical protein [Marinomonas sp. S3726]KJZ14881.1 hypothetical protein TW85_07255 [Marinomonas sp. S3726]